MSIAILLPPAFRDWFLRSRGIKVLQNIGWQLVTKGMTTLMGLAAAGWVARSLGPEQLGAYRNIQVMSGLIAGLVVLVSNQVLIHRLLSRPELENRIMGTAVGLAGIGGLVGLGVALACSGAFGAENGAWLAIAGCAHFPLLFMLPFAGWFESRMAGRVLATSNLAGMVVTRTWDITCAHLAASLIAFSYSTSAGLALMSAIVLWRYRKWGGHFQGLCFDRAIARDLIAASIPWIAWTFVNQAQTRCEFIMIAALLGKGSAGTYSAASDIIQPLVIIPAFLLSALYPSIVRSYAADHAFGQVRMQQYLRLSVALGVGASLALSLLGPWLAALVYGERFAESANLVRILSWTLLPAFLLPPSQAWMVKENLGWMACGVAFLGLSVSAACNYLLIPHFGLVGAAATASGSFLIGYLGICALFPRTRPLALMQVKALGWPFPSALALVPTTKL